jgi:hypothetical protein
VLSVAGLVSRVSQTLIGAPLSAQVEDRLSWPVGADPDALTEGFAPEGASSRDSGSVLALQLALACAAAGLVRLLAATAERRLPVTRARPWRRRTVVIVVAAACAGGMTLALAAGAAENLEDHWRAFRATGLITAEGDERLLAASANGRIEHWRVAHHTWLDHPLAASGSRPNDGLFLRHLGYGKGSRRAAHCGGTREAAR